MKPINVQLNNKTILIIGAAGFIGANLVLSLLSDNSIHANLIGVDNMNDYYDVSSRSGHYGRFKTLRRSLDQHGRLSKAL